MKHIKLFEAWEETSESGLHSIWADFHGPIPSQEELDQFGLTLDTLPDGSPRSDEYGYTLVGDLSDIKKYEAYIKQQAVTSGINNQPTGDWGGVYPGEKYHPQDR